jgi:transcriptional regulator with XRE-family HTH domain
LGISQKQYSNLETGHSKIDEDKIEKLAKAFDMNPADIVTFHEQNVFYQTFNNHKEAKSNNIIYHQNINATPTANEMMQTMISKLEEITVLLKK